MALVIEITEVKNLSEIQVNALNGVSSRQRWHHCQ